MSNPYRLVWMLVLYDLPIAAREDAREATRFRQGLEKLGFDRLQYSVYKRFCGSRERMDSYERKIRTFLPSKGEVRIMTITDKQYGMMRIYECEFSHNPVSLAARKKRGDVPVPSQYLLF